MANGMLWAMIGVAFRGFASNRYAAAISAIVLACWVLAGCAALATNGRTTRFSWGRLFSSMTWMLAALCGLAALAAVLIATR